MILNVLEIVLLFFLHHEYCFVLHMCACVGVGACACVVACVILEVNRLSISHYTWLIEVPYFPDCGALSDPANGDVVYTGGTTYGAIASYTCLAGYTLSHNNNRECLATGSWSYTQPTCNAGGKYLE